MIEQGTEEWFAERLGKITASRVKDVIAKTKTGPSASRKNYAAQLMLERVLGQRQDTYVNAAMQWGIEQEPLARLAYSMLLHTDVEVEEVSFINHPTIERSGASPDGLVGIDGMVELKCGNTATHCAWAIAGKVPEEHTLQMQWQMACANRLWCDFVSYDPRMPEGQQIFVRRLQRDDKLISELEEEVIKFDLEVVELVENLKVVRWT